MQFVIVSTSLWYSRRVTVAKRHKVHSLTGRIDMSLMLRAFRAVKRNRGAAGIDKVSLQMFEANLSSNLAALMFDLKHGRYHAIPLRRVYIPKGKGKVRPLGIPTVRDRVAQEVIRTLLEPIFEPTFSEGSYGFRPGRNAHQAIERILQFYRMRLRWIVDADIKGFFDNIPHELIIDLVAEKVADGNILRILREFLTAGVWEDGFLRPTTQGTPQGGVVSPLLANIVLDVLDQRLTQAGFRFVRYADDFVILCPYQSTAERALNLASEVLQNELGLSLSPVKTTITTFKQGFPFLGFQISSRGVSIRDKSVEKLKVKIRKLTTRSHNLGQETIRALNRVILGYAHYFATSFSTVTRQFYRLDQWIRKRLRCMHFKRISKSDNGRLRNRHLARIGLVSLHSLVA
jgi:group II intron reverse transcriptase/maturase